MEGPLTPRVVRNENPERPLRPSTADGNTTSARSERGLTGRAVTPATYGCLAITRCDNCSLR
jgi:hypothetical protein